MTLVAIEMQPRSLASSRPLRVEGYGDHDQTHFGGNQPLSEGS